MAENFPLSCLHDKHVVVMDNAACHQSNTTKELTEQAGATLLLLPPYSSDFYHLEQACAAIKKTRELHEHETIDNIIKNYNSLFE